MNFLHVEVAVAEGVGGFDVRGLKELRELVGGTDDAHAASAAAGRGLEDYGKTHGPRPFQSLIGSLQNSVGAGQDGDLGPLHGLAGFILFAHQAHGFGRGADELDVGGAADLGEVGVLAQQAVAGMDGVDIGDFRGGDDSGHVQVAVGRARGADADGLIGETNVQGVAVRLAVDRDRANPQFLAGTDDAESNFAAVRNE